MPFLRFSRDKRGYEHVYLMHAPSRRGKVGRPRILYWYRTPPGVKVGRAPFDEDVRRALEAQYPGVKFDWDLIIATPMPPPDAEPWRERRRAERAAKHARLAEEAEVEGQPESGVAPDTADGPEAMESSAPLDLEPGGNADLALTDSSQPDLLPTGVSAEAGSTVPGAPLHGRLRRRRRRPRRPNSAAISAPISGALEPPSSENRTPPDSPDSGDQ